MLLYHIRIGLKSLRRNPVLTAIIIAGVAVGICIATTITTVRHMFSKDPLPGKSERLFYVRMDNWDPATPYPDNDNDPHTVPTQIALRDAMELMRSNIPVHQTPMYVSRAVIFPDRKTARPYNENLRMTFGDFFPMFNVPFEYGSGWDRRADNAVEAVAVIDHETNEKLFGGVNSVGRIIRIEDRNFKVVGVLAPWRPSIRFYDLTQNYIVAPEKIYIPFNHVRTMKLRTAGNSDGWKSSGTTFEDFLASDTDWIQYWVELDKPSSRQRYLEYVDNYVRDQKRLGRFPRPLNNRVTPIVELMRDFGVVSPQMNTMAVVSILFLVVSSLNLMGLLLGKFLSRAPEVSVRRALGASRGSVFLQHIVECELVGIMGGIIGVTFSVVILTFIEKMFPVPVVLRLDGEMILTAAFLSLVAGLIAGIYPAWRICAIQPAMQLKVQ